MRCGIEKKKKDALYFLMPFPGRHKRETTPGAPAQAGKGRNGGKKWAKPVVFLLIIGAATAVAMTWRRMKAKAATARAQSRNTASAERRGISSELSLSGAPKAGSIYSITSMVEGGVLLAGFKEEDQAEKDQVLYEIDKSSMKSQLTSSVNFLTKSRSSYEDALEDYSDALSDYSGNTYKVTNTGYIKESYTGVEDKVSGNTRLADVYSDDIMGIRIPPLSERAAVIGVGTPAVVTLTDIGEQVAGMAKIMANQETVLTGERPVRVVTIQVPNPSGLTTSLKATTQIGEFVDSKNEVFEAPIDTTTNADPFVSVGMESLLVNVEDYVIKRIPVFEMTNRSADKLVQSYKGALDETEESMESAQNKLDSTQDNYDNYTVKAPVSGQVTTKSFKVGDNITKNSFSTMALATIYDLPDLTLGVSIGELDIKKAKVGQKVEVPADAFKEQIFPGTVINVSLENTYSNGVSTYPVTVTLDNMDDLLPGMNVDGVITLEEANDVPAIPADALMRRNQVYVKDNTVTEQQGSMPAGFRAVKVETGLTGDTFVKIKNDLSEGDVAYVAESNKNGSGVMIMMDGSMGSPPGRGGSMGGRNRGGSKGGQ